MSKAFTSDSDEGGEIPDRPPLPPGVRNYMTATGAKVLSLEVERLTQERRRLGTGIENQALAQKIDRQLRYWLPRLEAAEAIDPLTQPKDRVLFGATVTITGGDPSPQLWRIVGLDETDPSKGWISWMSPLASALLEKRVGDHVRFMDHPLTVSAISYFA